MAATIDVKDLAAAFAESLKAVQPPREIKEGDPEYVARQRAEGWFDEFPHKVFQNGYEAQARGIPEEIRIKAANLKPGKYLGGRVTVEVGQNEARYLYYPTKGDAMLINQSKWSSFEDLITKIWNESQAVPA